MKLVGADRLIEFAKKQDIQYIFCGHTHIADDYILDKGGIKVFCAGSSTVTS